jgi:hypothetical protein
MHTPYRARFPAPGPMPETGGGDHAAGGTVQMSHCVTLCVVVTQVETYGQSPRQRLERAISPLLLPGGTFSSSPSLAPAPPDGTSRLAGERTRREGASTPLSHAWQHPSSPRHQVDALASESAFAPATAGLKGRAAGRRCVVRFGPRGTQLASKESNEAQRHRLAQHPGGHESWPPISTPSSFAPTSST